MDEYQLALDNIEKQTQAYIDSGVSIVDAEAWKAEQIQILDDEETARKEEQARKETEIAEREAEKQRRIEEEKNC